MDIVDRNIEAYDDIYVQIKYNQYCKQVKYLLENHQKPHDRRYKQGFYVPNKPRKCVNIMETDEPQPIIWRSSWEKQFCEWCDRNDSVIRWGSELIKILYKNPLTNKMSYYVPDFYFESIEKDKKVHRYLIEIKPLKESNLSNSSNGYDKLMVAKNALKWQSAIIYCKKRGIEFKVLTDNFFNH